MESITVIMKSSRSSAMSDLLGRAKAALSTGEDQTALTLCNAALREDPKEAEAHFMLGLIAARHGRPDKALQAFGYALASDPRHAGATAHAAHALLSSERRPEALATAERAAILAERDPFSLDVTGVVMTGLGRHDRAAELYEKAASLSGQPDHLCNLAMSLEFLGHLDRAEGAYRDCLARDPTHARAWYGLTQISRTPVDETEIEAMRKATVLPLSTRSRRELGHALAKAHADRSDANAAMQWLRFAKADARSARSDPSQDQARLFDAAQAAAKTCRERPAGTSRASPIFIVGMPRTGTTLLERILSGHSCVTAGGELPDFPRSLRRLTGLSSRAMADGPLIERAAGLDADQIARTYLESVASNHGLSGRFIDKLPLNISLAPIILRALPEARVICLRRHPADTLLSAYRQLFEDGFTDLDHLFDLEWAATHYVRFDALVAHFRSYLPPDRFCEIQYESLVGDLETEARRLIDFCGLSFEDDCLNFPDNKAPVTTPSSAQVRAPLYASSIGRWRHYASGLKPALDILERAGLLSRDEIEQAEALVQISSGGSTGAP